MPWSEKFTAENIFKKACSFISQAPGDSGELPTFTPDMLDTLVYEALAYENNLRRYYKDPARPELAVAPKVASLEDVIPYHDEICRVALPYGLLAQFYQDDENEYAAQKYRMQYVSALKDVTRVEVGLVEDVYA